MRNLGRTVAAWLAATSVALAQTAPIYINNGRVFDPPQIDARAFVNNGTFDLQTLDLFESLNTLAFTNRGVMQNNGLSSSPGGFNFAYLPDQGGEYRAETFVNAASGSIFGNDIAIRATNLIHKGLLGAPNFLGLIRLEGENVDVSRGRFDIPSPDFTISQSQRLVTDDNGNPIGFVPEIGFFDSYWAATNVGMNVGRLLSIFTNASSTNIVVQPPPHQVIFPPPRTIQFGLVNAKGYVLTNAPNPTNQYIQAIFVTTTDTNLLVDASWEESINEGNPLGVAYVQLTTLQTNVITGGNEARGITIIDHLGSETNAVLVSNLVTGVTFKPSNYEVTIRPESGNIRSNSPVRKDLFTHYYAKEFTNAQPFTNVVVTNFYTGYRTVMSAFTPLPVEVAGSSLTNAGGRVDIHAKNLDLSNARIRAQGAVNIRAENLVNSTNAAIDVPYLNYTLGAANGTLRVQNLAQPFIQRLGGGAVQLWSAIWTNGFSVTVTNAPPDGGGGGEGEGGGEGGTAEGEVVTTEYSTVFHILVVNCTVQTRQQVAINELNLQAPASVVKDELRVTGPFRLASESLTVDGALALSAGFGAASPIRNWSATNSPALRYLTNRGTISVPGLINLGQDRAQPLDVLINTGTNIALGLQYRSRYFENRGDLIAYGAGLEANFESGNLTGGRLQADVGVAITGSQLKMRAATISSSQGTLLLGVTDSLTDSGDISAQGRNSIRMPLGVTLSSLPKAGALLGTVFEVVPSPNVEATILWPAKDRGASNEGYANNAAVGRLVLSAQNNSLITIRSIAGGTAMYVDYLELGPGMIDRLAETVQVEPGFKIYFAGSNIAADRLDGALDGTFVWVPTFAGPSSGVDVLLPDGRTTVRVNRAFRDSLAYDSDADGLANGVDASPFDGVLIEDFAVRSSPSGVTLAWEAAAKTRYEVQSATNLVSPTWSFLQAVENSALTNRRISLEISLTNSPVQRYFRVQYRP